MTEVATIFFVRLEFAGLFGGADEVQLAPLEGRGDLCAPCGPG